MHQSLEGFQEICIGFNLSISESVGKGWADLSRYNWPKNHTLRTAVWFVLYYNDEITKAQSNKESYLRSHGHNQTWIFQFKFFLCGLFLKSLLDLLQYCFCFLFWFFDNEAYGILGPHQGSNSRPWTGRWNLKHWKARNSLLLISSFLPL